MNTRTSKELARTQGGAAEAAPLSIQDLVDQTKLIQEAMKAVMRDGEHYGTIPGTGKPTLLKPGAEKLVVLFRMDPEYEVLESSENDILVSYTVKCTLYHSPSGTRLASGMGQANSREGKYRYRWVAHESRGTKEEQEAAKLAGTGRIRKVYGKWVWQIRVEEDNPMDYANTLLKMASKRALVAAVLNATAASDIFTQDLEDLKNVAVSVPQEKIDELLTLLDMAVKLDPKLWAIDVVLKNAQQRFQRQISGLEVLTETEADQILKGVKHWLEAQGQHAADTPAETMEEMNRESAAEAAEEPETVAAEEVEVMPSDDTNGGTEASE